MNAEDRKRVEIVLQKIPQVDWDAFLSSEEGRFLRLSMSAARAALDEAGVDLRGRTPKPTADIVHMLGANLLGHATAGPKVRSLIVRSLSPSRWERLRMHYRELAPARGEALHGNMVQDGAGADVVSAYWHRGSHWARRFCEVAGLPSALAQPSADVMPEDEVVVSSQPLPPLHDFQVEVYQQLRYVFARGTDSAVLALPTGAGKTRVVVEAVLDHLAQSSNQRRLVLWLAQTDELLRQAWACFRDVWQTAPLRADGRSIPRYGTFRLVRAWGGRRPDGIAFDDERTVVLATPHQLASWLRSDPNVFASWPMEQMAAAIIDEAHRAYAPEHRDVLVALGLRKVYGWEVPQGAPPVIGLTATPWRSSDEETRALQRYFHRLITPRSLKRRPIPVLQRRGILAHVTREVLRITGGVAMTPAQRRRYEVMHELPPDYLEALGRDPARNGRILRQLLKVPREKSVLVFACSIEHANVLTLALNKAGRSAACVTSATRRNERLELLHVFQQGDVQFLCNVGVLTTGFDAPRVDVVCLTRPTTSALLYEQMVGRGLRGPKNGGTTVCTVLDVQDEGLPDGIMSYERVLELWGG